MDAPQFNLKKRITNRGFTEKDFFSQNFLFSVLPWLHPSLELSFRVSLLIYDVVGHIFASIDGIFVSDE